MGEILAGPGRVLSGRLARGTALLATLAMLLALAAGCEKRGEKSTPAASSSGGAKATSTTKGKARASGEKSAKTTAVKPADTPAEGRHVHLQDKGCISFDLHWKRVKMGRSIDWHNHTTKTITLHIDPAAFGRDTYVIAAGKTVNSGPARTIGTYTITTSPTACTAAPLGAYGSGPGVIVEGGVGP